MHGEALLKSLIIALSIYSKIPVPQFPWREEDMRYTLCFFPLVGAVIGALVAVWSWFCGRCCIGDLARAAVGSAIPLLVSGGFHVDGFLDTMDAFHSYQGRERKLQILEDPHIGAFSVICLVLYYLVYVGAFSEVRQSGQVCAVAAGYFLARVLSGLGAVSFRCAKEEGLLYFFAGSAHRRAVKATLFFELVLCIGFMLWQSAWVGLVACAGAGMSFWYYRWRCYREFGGMTGDTAGYFVTLCEGVIVVLVALCGVAERCFG